MFEREKLSNYDAFWFIKLMMIDESEFNEEQKALFKKDVDDLFYTKILKKRIEAHSLNIKFTDKAFLAVSQMCKSPGQVVVLLIDCMNYVDNNENKTISTDQLFMSDKLYADGFYTQKGFEDRYKALVEEKNKFIFLY